MSKLETLIQQLCPDGVEYKTIGECCNVSAGGDVPKDRFSENYSVKYNIPIISNGIGKNSIYGFTDIPKVIGPAVTVAARGTIGYTEYRPYSYFPIIRLLSITPNNIIELDTKYLYYTLQGREYHVPTAGIPQLTVPNIKKEEIPCPPLEIQREIVRILDNFTELTTELTAELTARTKQYNYYLNTLLVSKCTDKVRALKTVCLSIADGDHMPPPKADSGVPFITISNITKNKTIDFSNVMYVPRDYYNKLADKRKARQQDVLYTVVGSFGTPVFVSDNTEFVFQRHIAILRPDKKQILPRYMYFAMQTSDFFKQADKAAKGAAQRTIGLASLGNMKIYVPSLEEQRRIVSILDRFDALCNDLTSGLPAEIEARKKQYEYYRDKLLQF